MNQSILDYRIFLMLIDQKGKIWAFMEEDNIYPAVTSTLSRERLYTVV